MIIITYLYLRQLKNRLNFYFSLLLLSLYLCNLYHISCSFDNHHKGDLMIARFKWNMIYDIWIFSEKKTL